MKRYCIICGNVFEAERKSMFKCNDCKAEAYSALGGYIRYCISCGKPFNMRAGRRYYCSDTRMHNGAKICREIKNAEEYAEQMNVKEKKPRKMSLAEINGKAREEHISYAEYVVKYGLE